ncbi:MAG TPA: hypothetical protein ACFYEF_04835 [Candidatus Wunengus sp. YC63]|uniref:hypothetical protein n=1 Tax=unclassified Candidatus Wunengus TaxID=3367695 RepID=UPI004028BDF9
MAKLESSLISVYSRKELRMQVVLNAPQSFENLSIQEKEHLVQELQEELRIRSEMIEGFKKPVEDFEDWEKLGFEDEEWN